MKNILICSMCISILKEYNSLDPENNNMRPSSWRPVIYNIISAIGSFPDVVFEKYLSLFYKPMVELILHVPDQMFSEALHSFFMRSADYLKK
jgi:hypothetical protein